MWVFSTIGFFSVVQKPGDSDLTVRARSAGDLDRLREKYLPDLSPTSATPKADYAFRARVPHSSFGRALAVMAADIRYPNFKDEVARTQGSGRAGVYAAVWEAARHIPSLAGLTAGRRK